MTTLDLLARHLRDQSQLGKERIQLNDISREFIRSIAKKHTQGSGKVSSKKTEENSSSPAQASTPSAADSTPSTQQFTQINWQAATSLDALKTLLSQQSPLPNSLKLHITPVFGKGAKNAALAFIGEAPEAEDEAQQEPFVSPAGQLLTRIISAMGLSRESVYLTNLLKYRPQTEHANQQDKSKNRLSKEAIHEFSPILLQELKLLAPRCIIALGASTHQSLLQEEIAIEHARAKVKHHPELNIPVISTYHPSYLLNLQGKAGEKEAKRLVWEDMLLALETAQLPITEKMRRFFGAKSS